ncbi:hypothetical protein SCLCIDRAFT_1214033 [Scleroderma citrinum Foug A]|uniref:Uncharacterized protein n=1 Tax=Scleroderma citrinum Foug A TaxID=1036808 RepID=A0A0C3E6M2_9AGAM|nr:hypothetical protein SCLCIDRAFT_1214033 [Scleroderma citrinum Foug A]
MLESSVLSEKSGMGSHVFVSMQRPGHWCKDPATSSCSRTRTLKLSEPKPQPGALHHDTMMDHWEPDWAWDIIPITTNYRRGNNSYSSHTYAQVFDSS